MAYIKVKGPGGSGYGYLDLSVMTPLGLPTVPSGSILYDYSPETRQYVSRGTSTTSTAPTYSAQSQTARITTPFATLPTNLATNLLRNVATSLLPIPPTPPAGTGIGVSGYQTPFSDLLLKYIENLPSVSGSILDQLYRIYSPYSSDYLLNMLADYTNTLASRYNPYASPFIGNELLLPGTPPFSGFMTYPPTNFYDLIPSLIPMPISSGGTSSSEPTQYMPPSSTGSDIGGYVSNRPSFWDYFLGRGA